MDLKTFLENFDTIAEAPGGIKKLRSLILDLAVRGRLVPQSLEDKPSEDSLLAMRIHRASWLKEQSDSSQECRRMLKKLSALEIPEPSFKIPKTWTYAHLIDLSLMVVDCHNKTASTQVKGIPLLRTSNIRNGKLRLSNLKYVSEETYQFWSRRCFPEPGDIIFTREAPIGEAAIIPEGMKVCLGQRTMLIRVLEEFVNRDFLLLALIEPGLLNRISGDAVGMTVKHLRVEDVEQIVLAVPPLAEQKRIVAKVDELMGICDRLEAAQQERESLRQKLRKSAIDALMNADDESLEKEWAIVHDNWQTLSQSPEDVGDLRQAVVQLGVEGKFTSQDFTDESASLILERALEKRKHLTTAKKISRREPQPLLEQNEVPFKLPNGWQCVRLGEIADIASGVTKGRKLAGRKTTSYPYLRVANVQRWNLDLQTVKEIEILEEELDRYKLQIGDVLLTEGGDWDKLGRSAIWRGEITNCIHQNHVFRARSFDSGLLPEWIVLFTNSLIGRKYFESAAKRTTNLASINMTQLRFCPFPVPPEEEQKRIVAKVDELMGMCDRLEESLRQTQQQSAALAASAINHLSI